MKRISLLLLSVSLSLIAMGQVVIVRPDLGTPTKIAPAYFGPNAFAVPEMLDDAVSPTLDVALSGRYHHGDYGDRTGDALAHVRIPLFTPRANLTLWMPVVEGYRLTPAWKEHARLAADSRSHGTEVGSAFISTDILVVSERQRRPAIALRAAMKTASEDDWTMARYYDTPGYFFDAAVGKEWRLGGGSNGHGDCGSGFNDCSHSHGGVTLRVGASAGFLCWQTDNGRQNDATMYALQVKLKTRRFTLAQDLRGYSGWEHDGDCPMVVKTEVMGHFGRFLPFLSWQKGVKDFPFQQFAIGLKAHFDILHRQRKA